MVTTTIPLEKLTRLYLIKQHLFTKAKPSQLEEVVSDVCGLHAQAQTTPYLSLWNRVEHFENQLLDDALYGKKSLVKTWVMRGTLHVIPSGDLPCYNRALRRMWFEHHGRYMRAPDWPPIEERKTLIYPKILEALAHKPLRRKELNARVQSLLKDNSKPYQRLFSGWGGILKETAYEGLTVHSQPCERESCFARLDKWLPNMDLDGTNEEVAQKRLLIKYLHGYGPATQQDFCLWSGMMAGDAKRAIQHSSDMLEEVEVENRKGRFIALKEDLKTLDSLGLDEKAPACLLPKFDSILLGHKDRNRIIKEEYKRHVFKPKVGDIAATILINGQIAGTWRHKKTRDTLTIRFKPFEKIQREDLKEIEEKAKDLGQYMKTEQVELSLG